MSAMKAATCLPNANYLMQRYANNFKLQRFPLRKRVFIACVDSLLNLDLQCSKLFSILIHC